jgi:hypothetical protein
MKHILSVDSACGFYACGSQVLRSPERGLRDARMENGKFLKAEHIGFLLKCISQNRGFSFSDIEFPACKCVISKRKICRTEGCNSEKPDRRISNGTYKLEAACHTQIGAIENPIEEMHAKFLRTCNFTHPETTHSLMVIDFLADINRVADNPLLNPVEYDFMGNDQPQ